MNLEKLTQNLKTNLNQGLKIGFLGLFIFLFTNQVTAQQCPLVCNNDVQISLDDDCQVEVTPDMILEGEGPISCDYQVEISDMNGNVIPTSPIITNLYVGKTLQVSVSLGTDPNANSCWGLVHIEDKIRPTIECPDTAYVECYAVPAVYPLPLGIDNCGGNVSVVELSDETINLDCDSEYSAQRTIVYQATDGSGNVSDLCYRVIYYVRVNLADVIWPLNHDGIQLDMLPCSATAGTPFWDENDNYYPDPEETGVPHTMAGADVYPNNILCELNVVYADDVLDICSNSFKVLREWTILDWCTGDLEKRFQIIKVLDGEGPIVTALPDNLEAYSHPYTCFAEFLAPAPIVIFDCGETSYTVEYKIGDGSGNAPVGSVFTNIGVTGNATVGYTLHDLPAGRRVWVRYTVTDDCGNITYAFTEVDVVDNVPPVAVCDQFTVVTLTNTGYAYVEALSFDDGSHDNCTDVSFRVRRMVSGCGSSGFGDYVIFCCTDLGNTDLMVELEVSDEYGNVNTCMVNVTVQDKLKPVIDCPDDITIDCTEDYTDLSLTGEATAYDNCGTPAITYADAGNLGNCNTGVIFRTFTATDADGKTDKCTQRITVINNHPFTGAITWPKNKTLEGCMEVDTDPSNPVLGEPIYQDDACSLIAHTYEDQVFTFVDDACFKILRHWTVIDWCVYEETNGNYGIWGPHTQVIKVFDNDAPVIADCTPKEFCIYEASDTQCGGQVTELIQSAEDDCSGSDDELTWSYVIEEDLDDDGVYDFHRSGSARNANGYFETGKYKIKWIVEDNCGNAEKCTQLFTVKDCKKPTPYCLGEVTTVVMNSTGTIETWASDFDLGSFDNCPGELKFSFSGTTYTPNKTFTCDDLGLNTVQMWVWDEAGNKDFCEVVINIQDHSDTCPDPSGVTIAGLVRNEDGNPLEGASVEIKESGENVPVVHTSDEDGAFKFVAMTENANFGLEVTGEDDYMNGVSTLDLLLIQRHILKIKEFTSPYKVIAADINNSASITASDLIGLRKLILGKTTALPNNESWRFVDGEETYDDVRDPFPFTEKINLYNVEQNDMTNNFVAVKIGDVNGTATMAMATNNTSEERNRTTVNFEMQDINFEAGDKVSVRLSSEQAKALVGFQFAINFDESLLTYNNIVAEGLPVTQNNIGSKLASRGQLMMSWSDAQSEGVSQDEALFTLVFTAKESGTLSNAIQMDNKQTKSEAYDNELNVSNLNLKFVNKIATNNSFELMQNEPNPFSDMTSIRFNLPQASTVNLNVYDVTGKLLLNQQKECAKGSHSFEISKEQLNVSGILYYQLDADQFTATKKMVLMSK